MWVVSGKLFARFTRRNYQFTQGLITSNSLALNQLQYVGASYDHNTGVESLWLDGQQVVQTNIVAGLILDSQDNIIMGSKEGDRRYFRGRITVTQIYDVPLTEEQVNAVKIRGQGNHCKVTFLKVFSDSRDYRLSCSFGLRLKRCSLFLHDYLSPSFVYIFQEKELMLRESKFISYILGHKAFLLAEHVSL